MVAWKVMVASSRHFTRSVLIGAWAWGVLACGYEWEAAYAARFGHGLQGGSAGLAATAATGGASSPSGGGASHTGSGPSQGGNPARGGADPSGAAGSTSPTGGSPSQGGNPARGGADPSGAAGGTSNAGTSPTGGSPPIGGNDPGSSGGISDTGGGSPSGGTGIGGGAGGGGGAPSCNDNLVINAGFEQANGESPLSWTSTSPPSSLKYEVVAVASLAIEGTLSLFVDTTSVKKPPADYVLVVASNPWTVSPGDLFHLAAAAMVTDPVNPVRVAVLYYDEQGALLDLLEAPALSFSPSSSFELLGPIQAVTPAGAASARVGVLAGTGVSAYVDAICLTK